MMLRTFLFTLALLLSPALRAQSSPATDPADKNAAQARAVLEATIQALGGQAWLEQKNFLRQGHIAAFYQDKAEPGTTDFWEYHQWPGRDRIEFGKHRDVLQMFVDREGWDLTYRGKKALPEDVTSDFLRRRDHSIELALKVWYKNPNTILIYEGKQMAGRHLCDQVTLISPENESTTILSDISTHLPLRRVFQWRDPVYKDKNTDVEEYDDYHVFQGFPTPLRITRSKNGEMFRQYYIDRIEYNQTLPDDFWDVTANARRLKK